MSLFVVEGLSVRIDKLAVLSDVGVAVDAGEAVGIFGPNGSGKTSLLNAISGLLRVTAGRVKLAGVELTNAPPHRIATAGIARTFQTPRLFRRQTVEDNIKPVTQTMAPAAFDALLDAFDLRARRDDCVAELSLFDIKRLEIARALARRPRLLLLDEPTGGLTAVESDGIVRLVREHVLPLAAVLVVEHRLEVLRSLCGRAVALDHGIRIAEGPLAEIEQLAQVRHAYFGGSL